MLPKSKRIPRKLFKSILEERNYANSEHFSSRSANSNEARLAVSVSKKVSKSAVARNRVRRRAYSALIPMLPRLAPRLVLIMAKPGAEKLKAEALTRELEDLLKRAGLIVSKK